ncbi:MAG: aminotransferase class III-fold pyridoxal phosphate-dependent enzyme, partial [Pseudomonadota bacterium]|nr:aminotransferase class III-fold pyridoxal phosphate-dependent enzyme [Pseudomonadota bacterium]
MKTDKSSNMFERAKKCIPGGVNSPVRSFGKVAGPPPFIERGYGAHVFDADGNEYIDFCLSWGPLILGHADKDVVASICAAARKGTSFGACHECEIRMAELILDGYPEFERVRLVNSGTEAVMTAIRLARGHTGRRKILKFDGCYHGHSDYLLVASGSGLLTGGISSSAGVSPSATEEVFVAPYNDLAAVQEIL